MTLQPIHAAPTLTTHKRLRDASHDLEKTFIAEMLKAARVSENSSPITGGPEGGHFSNYLHDHYAQAITRNNQIGLAEGIFQAMKNRGESQ